MTEERKSSLLKYAARPAATDNSKPVVVSELQEYQAAKDWMPGELDRGQLPAILIPFTVEKQYDNAEEVIAYTQFMTAYRETAADYLALVFTIGNIEVFGENLRPILLKFLPPGQVKELVIFDPAIHQEPKAGEPVIHRIRYRSRVQDDAARQNNAPPVPPLPSSDEAQP